MASVGRSNGAFAWHSREKCFTKVNDILTLMWVNYKCIKAIIKYSLTVPLSNNLSELQNSAWGFLLQVKRQCSCMSSRKSFLLILQKRSREIWPSLYFPHLNRAESKGSMHLKVRFCQTGLNLTCKWTMVKRQMGEIYGEPFGKWPQTGGFPKGVSVYSVFSCRRKVRKRWVGNKYMVACWLRLDIACQVCLFLSEIQKLFHCTMRRAEGLGFCDWLLFWKRKKIIFHFLSIGAKSPVAVWRTFQITATTVGSFWVCYFWLTFCKCSHHSTQNCK